MQRDHYVGQRDKQVSISIQNVGDRFSYATLQSTNKIERKYQKNERETIHLSTEWRSGLDNHQKEQIYESINLSISTCFFAIDWNTGSLH